MRTGAKKMSARRLRQNCTAVEEKLWKRLRRKQFFGHRFRRQHPVGPYIADFACIEGHLIIEFDGGQHAIDPDTARDAYLRRHGWNVLRFWNNLVNENMDGILYEILRHLNGIDTPPP